MLVEDSGLTVERWNGVGSELSQILKSLKRRLGVGGGGGGGGGGGKGKKG